MIALKTAYKNRTYNGKKCREISCYEVEDIGVVENVPEEPATEVKFTSVFIVGVIG